MKNIKLYFRIALFLLVALAIPGAAAAQTLQGKEKETKITIQVKASSDAVYKNEYVYEAKSIAKDVIENAKRGELVGDKFSDTDIHAAYRGNSLALKYSVEGELFDPATNEQLLISEPQKKELDSLVQQARAGHFGSLTDWKQVNERVPKFTKFTVLDMDTGLQFQGERRAGSNHADVQPLTKTDSQIMKQIYDGKWSWNRRAVVVIVEGERIAGSMHGMPHGGDGIPGNGFSGHFCIHFLNSITHGKSNKDPAHQLMVHKAAGKLHDFFAEADPFRVIDSFIAAMHHNDIDLLAWSLGSPKHAQLEQLREDIPKVEAYRKLENKNSKLSMVGDQLSVNIPVKIEEQYEGKRPQRKTYMFYMKRNSLNERWQIESVR